MTKLPCKLVCRVGSIFMFKMGTCAAALQTIKAEFTTHQMIGSALIYQENYYVDLIAISID